jgi:hypothetical protein
MAFPVSAEGESVGLHARIEEANFEGAIHDRAILPDQAIEPMGFRDARPVGANVRAMGVARRRAIYRDAETNGLAVRAGSEHEM